MTWRRLLVAGLCGLAALVLPHWAQRARLAAELARH